MKLKGLLIVTSIVFLIFIIYLTTLDKDVYYLALGDFIAEGIGENQYPYEIKNSLESKEKLEKYIPQFISSDSRTTDYIRMINENETRIIHGKKQTLKNALIKADLLTLSVGNNDLFYSLGIYNHSEITNIKEAEHKLNELMKDMEELFQLLREYCKEDILMTGFYYPTSASEVSMDMIEAANHRLKRLTKQYGITLIAIDQLLKKSGNLDQDSSLPTKNGYRELSQIIEKESMNMVFEKN